MDDRIWRTKESVLRNLMKIEDPEKQNRKYSEYYHYTSIPTLFNILERDELWASNIRFSNDFMEERMLGSDGTYSRDDYVICFCAEGDQLSQWRGYCYNGGASIKIHFDSIQEYSVLRSDYDTTGRCVIRENVPLPVVYVSQSYGVGYIGRKIEGMVEDSIEPGDILPYLKNASFYEEKELRLVFANIDNELSQCIRFRNLSDGVKVPYIVVKPNDIVKMNRECKTNPSDFTEEYLDGLMQENENIIWIEEGFNQERVYFEVLKRVEQFKKDRNTTHPFKIFCKGRLPIEEIIVAPTYDRKQKVEQIKRFCMSKYWLTKVKVKESEIPYIRPM